MTMHKSKTIDCNGRKVVVHELTVLQIKNWMDSAQQESARRAQNPQLAKPQMPHILDMLMERKLPAQLIFLCVPDVTEESLIEDFYPSDLEHIYDAVEEMNPFLSRMTRRAVNYARAIVGQVTSSSPQDAS